MTALGLNAQNSEADSDSLELSAKTFEFTVNPVFPINTFGDRLQKDIVGVSLSYLVQRDSKNYDFWGVQLSYTHMGSLSNDISVAS